MDPTLVVVAIVGLLAAGVAQLVKRRRPSPPTAPTLAGPPAQVDRADFVRPEAPWLVLLFTSATCASCDGVKPKAELLASAEVAVEIVEFPERRDLHERYRIEQVPMVLIADVQGTVRQHFLGPVSATHLWAAIAELREPGSVPPGCGGHHDGEEQPRFE